MDKIIKAIQDYYNGRIGTDVELEQVLMTCKKEELIEFIIAHQQRGCFKGIVY